MTIRKNAPRLLTLAAALCCALSVGAATHGETDSAACSKSQYNVFITKPGEVPYRIPALAQARNGNLVAVADYRFCGSDIGYGSIDLQARISKDNGKTWGDISTIVRGDDYPDKNQLMSTGFGDAALVADRRSNSMLLLCCSGDVSYQRGTRTKHQAMARLYSHDGGQTWTKPEDIEKEIYGLVDQAGTDTVQSMFVGSGRIFQSTTLKVGTHYRLYCALLARDTHNVYKNYVIYSDDFGQTWHLLGDAATPAIPRNADEPKVEELPDGSILCSSRVTNGRLFNIFKFTDSKTAKGAWDTAAFSGKDNHGVAEVANSCNGEVFILPVCRKVDGKKMHIALQSLPAAKDREKVTIAWKALESKEDYDTPEHFASDWDGHFLVSNLGSAYSTMALLKNRTIGFLYEELTYGSAYTIVYQNFSIEEITGSRYEFRATKAYK